jgi:dephospho-CoA kinase
VSRWPNKYVIGLTGNIAVGKSVVRQMLQHLGAYTIDADGLAHQAMAPGAPAYKPVVDTFGQFILDSEKRIDRSMLGNIVFSHPDALAKLEAITHPVINQAINTLISRSNQRVIVVEAIKLLESDLSKAVDEVWVVDASPQTQLQRLMEKRKMSEADARKRISAQPAQAEKLQKATVVIKNDGNVEETWKQVQTAWDNIRRKLTGEVKRATSEARQAAQPAQAAPATPPARPATPAAPAPAAPAAPAAPSGPITVEVKRGMPSNAEVIANFINKVANKGIDRMDVMMSFGQKSYLLAQAAPDRVVAVMGWQVENLITRVDEFYIEPSVPRDSVVAALSTAVEAASRDLQSEVSYIFLPTSAQDIINAFVQNGYEATTVNQIKIPAWREAVEESVSEGQQILSKKLREDRVLKPI